MAPSGGKMAATVAYLVHHIVLPPQLPQEDDHDASHDRDVLSITLQALRSLKSNVEVDHVDIIVAAIATIETLRDIRDNSGRVSEVQLDRLLKNLRSGELKGIIPIEVNAQNAGILITRGATSIAFESFELSPTNTAAMKVKGRLIRTFPAAASKVTFSDMASNAFNGSLARTISKLAIQPALGMQPTVRKNRQQMKEERDTTSPAMVTDYLMNLIAAHGDTTEAIRITKHTREEVLWNQCLKPWRRSPLWLLIRVSLQLLFTRNGKSKQPPDYLYKAFMVQLLAELLDLVKYDYESIGSETLHAVSAKLCRRLRKLEDGNQGCYLQPRWMTQIREALLSSHDLMDKQWQKLAKSTPALMDVDILGGLTPKNDLDIILPDLNAFIGQVKTRASGTASFSFKPTSELPAFPASQFPQKLHQSGVYEYYRLNAFEYWVKQHLDSWLESHLRRSSTCGDLRRLMQSYQECAGPLYADDPVSMSIMYLTILELWAANDKSACAKYPLLHDYDPEIELSDCQCLLLPFKEQMARLHEVERYSQSRRAAANTHSSSVAKATVFELKIPQAFSDWRDASAFVLKNVLGFRYSSLTEPVYTYGLEQHHGLAYLLSNEHRRRRIVPISDIKSHTTSHRNFQEAIIDLRESDVCLENALRYKYYDKVQGVLCAKMESNEHIPQKCLIGMPDRSKAMRRFFYKPPSSPEGLASNEVLASLADCPPHFSIDEFKAFCSVPLGQAVAYTNILAQLAIPIVDFAKVETQCMTSQVVHQAGLPSDGHVERKSHRVLTEGPFANAMLDQVGIALRRIAENWESWRAAATLIQLAQRILSLNMVSSVQKRALEFLYEARAICHSWFLRLKHRVALSTDDDQRSELCSRATEIGLLCTTTFNVEHTFIEDVLRQPSAIDMLVQSCVVVQENLDNVRADFPELHTSHLHAWKSLMFRIFPNLRKRILHDNKGMNQAILANWAAFKPTPGTQWSKLGAPQDHWLTIMSGKLHAHYNLLTAQLLVEGTPLSRLPDGYSRHALYTPLFGRSAIEVVPTDEAGLRFSAKAPFHDHKLHFGWSHEDMLVVAIHEGGDCRIMSHEYRGMMIDRDQNIGTLIGLTTRLVLRHSNVAQEQRLLLIPAPPDHSTQYVTYTRPASSHHTSVSVNKNGPARTYAYYIDQILGRIIDNGDLQSKLFLSYLHALTSHCMPDPLTGYTGTELALNILRSASVRSFDVLHEANIALLRRIAAISPRRSFYPAHLMDMQQIEWDANLPSHSQHPDFHSCVQAIIRVGEQMRFFHPGSTFDLSIGVKSNAHLDTRDAIRSSTFRTHNYGAEHFTIKEDAQYVSRDEHPVSDRGHRAYKAATMVVRDFPALSCAIPNMEGAMLTNHFHGSIITGVKPRIDVSELQYDTKWLQKPSQFLKEHWCTLHRKLYDERDHCNVFDIATWLSTMAYADSADMTAIQVLAAFYMFSNMSGLTPPSPPSFDLSEGEICKAGTIKGYAEKAKKKFNGSSESKMPKQTLETNAQHSTRIRALFNSNSSGAVQSFTSSLCSQWPCSQPIAPNTAAIETYVKVSDAMTTTSEKFTAWYNNRQFSHYLENLSAMVARLPVVAIPSPRNKLTAPERKFSLKNATHSFACSVLHAPAKPDLSLRNLVNQNGAQNMRSRLEQLCIRLKDCTKSTCEKQYVEDLQASCTLLEQQDGVQALNTLPIVEVSRLLHDYLASCEEYLAHLSYELIGAIKSNISFSEDVGISIRHCPRLSPTFWLSQLHQDRFHLLSKQWKMAVINYGLAVTHVHRAHRLSAASGKPVDLAEELRHIGHSNWDPMEFPELLLLEAESSITIRKEQEFIASQMRNPGNNSNIVLQLLMGGGKSSTIVPMLATNFTDKQQLARVIVAKPQSKQMHQMLVAKIGGLLNRRIYHMPFSRNLRVNPAEAAALQSMYEECIKARGVLLIQPEHILSFKLMGVESLLEGRYAAAAPLLDAQKFFDRTTRDIVDESDMNFSVKFELIYTMGSQQSVEFAPERWLIIEDILGLLQRFAEKVKTSSPQSIEIEYGDWDEGKVPRIRILHPDAAEDLLMLLAKHIIEFGITGLPIRNQDPSTQAAVLRYITEPELTDSMIHAVEKSTFWTDSTKSPLLLIRGLIACGVLRFVLSTKRWRVNFGLDPSRSPKTCLAVPYRSKDAPSPRSEFSHPEVVILLTLLSYYYGGLSNDELFDTFTHILKSDQAAIHYNEWIETAAPGMPSAYRNLSGVSIRDRHQCIMEVFPHLRYSKKAIDYYLSFLVFPKEMKQFPRKLSGSGWDIGAIKTHPTTGFSGTNDTLHLLPLSVKHLDLPSQSHTNALVLGYLLRDETTVQLLPPRQSGSDADHLLRFIYQLDDEVRVMLDCGAAILEQNNLQVAQTWLKLSRGSDVQAVVFFEDEELSVLERTGRVEPLQTSPFAKQLDSCLVYLDESHSRGTDLKLPRNYRAAVTLGSHLCKDTLTQACMRMRLLGKGQAITFIVPEEISTKIRERTGKSVGDSIKVSDVLCWSICETWDDLKRSMPLWAVQGHRYETHKHLLHGANTTVLQAKAFLEDEAQSLEDRYRPRLQKDSGAGLLKDWDMSNQNICKIVKRCQDFEAMGFGSATLSEEQERELAPEIEEERQVERPPRMEAATHILHPDLEKLVKTGILPLATQAFGPAFHTLRTTSAAPLFNLANFPNDLLCTADYVRTVKKPTGTTGRSFVSDAFHRPIQWIMSVCGNDGFSIRHLIILSPHEANALLEPTKKYAKVTIHLFAPRTNASFDALDKLELYNVGRTFSPHLVPRSLTMQLNLFAGSLYLRSFAEYTELCDFLGLLQGKAEAGQQVHADGFIDPPTGKWGLKASPVHFFRVLLMKIRREGEGVEKTHLGKILNGMRLEPSDFKKDG
ncbi:hypothetical protein BKA63DRAFT_464782 [Paraphoma chrysanthemicola]|nr:hypothetical protein BKA63DRAFT_464782 [Paraphoma chrysanthemicola]